MNPLLAPLHHYFQEVAHIKGDLVTFKSALGNFSKLNTPEYKLDWFNEATIVFRDITITEGVDLRTTGYSTQLNKTNFKESITRIESRESLLVFSQVYEVFESFLKHVLIGFFENNESHLNNLGALSEKLQEHTDITSFVNFIQSNGKNNRKILWVLRKLSEHYKYWESNNRQGIKLNIWFDLMTDIRHSIVHTRMLASEKFNLQLSKNNKREIFNRNFWLAENDSSSTISTSSINIDNEITHLNSFAYLICTSLSDVAGEEFLYE